MVWAYVFFFEQVGKFFDKFSELGNYKPSENEIQAGIEDLSSFPPYIGICKPLAEKFGQPIEYFLETWDADTLFMFLLHDYVEHQIQRNLAQLEKEDNIFK